jgi:hypothetical protein
LNFQTHKTAIPDLLYKERIKNSSYRRLSHAAPCILPDVMVVSFLSGYEKIMKQKKSQCPLTNPLNCKEYYNPNLCAFVRKDGKCTKKKKNSRPDEKKAGVEN